MKIDELFDNADEITADKIAGKYPVLDEDHKERLFAMTRRKYAALNSINDISENEVHGVEKYRRPKWYKAVSIAAAAVLTLGGIGGSVALISRNRNVPGAGSVTVTEAATAEAVTEPPTSEILQEADCIDIAKELVLNYYEISDIIMRPSVSVDMNDCISFYIYNSEDSGWTDEFAHYCDFYRVTDERFDSIDDIYDYYKQYVSAENCSDSYETAFTMGGSGMLSYFGGDISKFQSGESIDIAGLDGSERHFFYCSYVYYNGVLYAREPEEQKPPRFASEPVISGISEDGFTASINIIPEYANENDICSSEDIYRIIREDGKWKIDSIEDGEYIKGDAISAVECFFEYLDEYNDLDLDGYTYDAINLSVTDYDKNANECRVSGTIKDINGNDAVEIDAHIDLEKNEVIDIDITRLTERDESLKRKSVLWREELYKVARAVQKYIEEDDAYNVPGLDTDYRNIYTKIYEYDEASGCCTAHAEVYDTGGNTVYDWNVSVDLNSETVLSAEALSF